VPAAIVNDSNMPISLTRPEDCLTNKPFFSKIFRTRRAADGLFNMNLSNVNATAKCNWICDLGIRYTDVHTIYTDLRVGRSLRDRSGIIAEVYLQ
jgi:hypothetical protein